MSDAEEQDTRSGSQHDTSRKQRRRREDEDDNEEDEDDEDEDEDEEENEEEGAFRGSKRQKVGVHNCSSSILRP